MGEKLDEMGESLSLAGGLAVDSTVGVVQGVILGAWPLLMLGLGITTAVLIVRLPRRLL